VPPERTLPPLVRVGRNVVVFVSAVLALAGTGAAVTVEPAIVLLPVGAIGVAVLCRSCKARAIFVVCGGLAILQSSQSITAPKVGYLVGVITCFAIAIANLRVARDEATLVRGTWLVGVAIAISFVAATIHGTTVSNWARDAIGYVLFAMSPILALDFAKAGQRLLRRLFVIAGLVATVSFTAEWISKHGLGTLPFSQFALSSYMLVAAAFAYACACTFVRERPRAFWLGIAVFTFGALLLTGARSSLAILAAPFIILFAPGMRSASRAVKTVAVAGVLAVLLTGAVVFVGSATGVNGGGAIKRVASLLSPSATAGTYSSTVEREIVTTLAWNTYKTAPIFGVGVGYTWSYVLPYDTPTGSYESTLTPDTTVAVIAEFGAVGFGLLLCYLWILLRYAWRPEPSAAGLGLLGTVAIFVVYSLTTNAFDDKGLGLALALLLSLVMAGNPRPGARRGGDQVPTSTVGPIEAARSERGRRRPGRAAL